MIIKDYQFDDEKISQEKILLDASALLEL